MNAVTRIIPLLALVGFATGDAGAQIRTPIASEPLIATTPGPAPLNAKALATAPTSATVSWDAAAGVRAYTVVRTRMDNPTCCVVRTGLLTTPSWIDGALEAGVEYSFAISALYFDGRVGATEVVAVTPVPPLPTVKLSRNVEMSSAEGVLRLTPCGQKNSGGPGPGTITPFTGSPAGGRFSWTAVSGVNYVVDRAPEGTTTWTLVGSTCGGPSPITLTPVAASVRDLAGGVSVGSKYVYRITAIDANGRAGWNTYHFRAPCKYAPALLYTVDGSTVTVRWQSGSNCSMEPSVSPDTYTLSSSFGFTKTKSAYGWSTEVLYGVPVGTHTFRIVGDFRTGGKTTVGGTTITVAY